jgi:hypothetical protein
MKLLSNYDKSKTLSEQTANNIGSDVGSIMQELNNFNSDEQKIVDIVKKYKTKTEFQSFINQYKTISGKDFGKDFYRAIQPYNDPTEWNDLKNHLSTIGVTLASVVDSNGSGNATFTFGKSWEDFPCVTKHPSAKAVKLTDGSSAYTN